MKVLTMVLFVVGMTTLSSCTKSNSDLILGKWMLYKATATYAGQSIVLSMSDIAAIMGSEISEDEFIVEFKSDGLVYESGEPGPARYTIDGDRLSIITPEETFNLDIVKLTSSELVVDMVFDEEEMSEVKGQLYFKRV